MTKITKNDNCNATIWLRVTLIAVSVTGKEKSHTNNILIIFKQSSRENKSNMIIWRNVLQRRSKYSSTTAIMVWDVTYMNVVILEHDYSWKNMPVSFWKMYENVYELLQLDNASLPSFIFSCHNISLSFTMMTCHDFQLKKTVLSSLYQGLQKNHKMEPRTEILDHFRSKAAAQT